VATPDKENVTLPQDNEKPPVSKVDEEEALARTALCVRVMESFFESVDEDPKLREFYAVLYCRYVEALQREIEPFAFDLAIALFSQSSAARAQRGEGGNR
jgi:hypothetical protein